LGIALALGTYSKGVPAAYLIPPTAFDSDYDIKRFVDIAPSLGVDTLDACGGCIVDDFDDGGFLDFVTSTWNPTGPLTYYRNLGNSRFEDRSSASRLDDQLGGMIVDDEFHNVVFHNPGHGNRFLRVELVGTKSNRGAVGARLAVTVETPEGVRSIHRAVGIVSSFGGSPLRQEIGLGDTTAIKSPEVWWPPSDTRQVFTDLSLDSYLRVTEGDIDFEVLPRRSFVSDH
jgi:hypothetical protein